MYGLIALNFIIPFVMVFVGYILKKHPVKDMTSGNGYTESSGACSFLCWRQWLVGVEWKRSRTVSA